MKNNTIFLVSGLILLAFFLINIAFGQVNIPIKDVVGTFFGAKTNNETWHYIIINYRVPKSLMAVFVGIGLGVSGLLIQTMFRNPLAGPYTLGLSSGSSLSVALVVMSSSFLPVFLQEFLTSAYSTILASCFGSLLVLVAILFVSRKLKDTMTILIVGLMFGSFTSAFVGVLTYFSDAESLQKYTFWAMGNIGNVDYQMLFILSISLILGLIICFFQLKSLDSMLLGENYATTLGVNISKTRLYIILSTSLLTGSITAFAGPIAFVGLAVPHIARIVFNTSQHKVLFWATLIFGAVIMLFCDFISNALFKNIVLPINAVTSIIGAPIVIYLVLNKRR